MAHESATEFVKDEIKRFRSGIEYRERAIIECQESAVAYRNEVIKSETKIVELEKSLKLLKDNK